MVTARIPDRSTRQLTPRAPYSSMFLTEFTAGLTQMLNFRAAPMLQARIIAHIPAILRHLTVPQPQKAGTAVIICLLIAHHRITEGRQVRVIPAEEETPILT